MSIGIEKLTTIAWRFAHKFPSRLDKPIAILTVPLDYIVTRFGMKPESWEVDRLGAARGVFVRLPSGRIVLILELAHATKHLGALVPGLGRRSGPDRVRPLVDEVVRALGLSEGAVAWKAGEDLRTCV